MPSRNRGITARAVNVGIREADGAGASNRADGTFNPLPRSRASVHDAAGPAVAGSAITHGTRGSAYLDRVGRERRGQSGGRRRRRRARGRSGEQGGPRSAPPQEGLDAQAGALARHAQRRAARQRRRAAEPAWAEARTRRDHSSQEGGRARTHTLSGEERHDRRHRRGRRSGERRGRRRRGRGRAGRGAGRGSPRVRHSRRRHHAATRVACCCRRSRTSSLSTQPRSAAAGRRGGGRPGLAPLAAAAAAAWLGGSSV